MSLAEVSLTLLDGARAISDNVVVGVEDLGTADEDSVGDDTIIADGAILTANEVEEVLRDAFAETDRLVPAKNVQQSTTLVGGFLTSGWSGPSFGCIDVGPYLLCQGTSPPHLTKVRPERCYPRVSSRTTFL